MKITDQHLEELGFHRNDVTAEESGHEPFTYWDLGLSDVNPNFAILSCANDEREDGIHWHLEFIDVEDCKITEYEHLKNIITAILESKNNGKNQSNN